MKQTTAPIQRINDFVVKFANVNGSGSASANLLFAKSILRMGIPVAPRNIFPSNIQGLPTWFEVRVNEAGWRGRRGGVDLMVAMNPQTWDQDLKEIEPGGYLFYDSTRQLPASMFRDDITVIGMPLTEICNREYTDSRQRQLFKNIVYVGALSALLEIEPEVIAEVNGRQARRRGRGRRHRGAGRVTLWSAPPASRPEALTRAATVQLAAIRQAIYRDAFLSADPLHSVVA